ncbi:MFS transporter [Bifidobacterium oedipodis]|uniref:MFS transporter n=1 Tax=Bifidobacterium oedipodis TaxID=2675322 RepID=A0A7Y0ES91_9BIFI|nr:MFS transporter [Bifidobacterium sp. DSM 109957]NMM95053.1 MFS transporter [Bifidobacterium sp. DSM 109957]
MNQIIPSKLGDTKRNPLRSRDFVLLVAGQGISLFGNMMLRFAMSMWVLDATGSATVFATILAISIVPTIVLSPFGGVLADRMNRRTIMVALDAASGTLVLICALVFVGLGFNIAAIAMMQVLLAVLGAFETPTVQAALPQLIGRSDAETLRKGMAVINQVQQLSSLLPSFLGGVLYAMCGIHLMMGITVTCFALAAVLECFIRLDAPERATDAEGNLPTPIEDLKAGLRFLTHERPQVFQLLLFAAALNFIIIGFSGVGFPYTIRTVLGFNATVYGVADGLVGVFGVIGAFAAGLFSAKLTMRRFPLTMWAFVLMMVPQGLVFLLPSGVFDSWSGVKSWEPWCKLVILVAFTCGTIVASSFANLIAIPTIQLSTPEAMTGKVMSMVAALSMCAQPLGQLLYGWAYDRFSVAAVLLASAAGLAVLGVLIVPLSKRFDALER